MPPIREKRPKEIKLEFVERAISTAKEALKLFTAGIPIVKGAKEIHVDVPVMYLNFAIDRIHYDPQSNMPSPKGRPVRALCEVNIKEIRKKIDEVLKECYAVEAAEFREPEDAWIIPIAWRKLIIMHVKVSYDGMELIPDYGLTEEVRRYAH